MSRFRELEVKEGVEELTLDSGLEVVPSLKLSVLPLSLSSFLGHVFQLDVFVEALV